MSGGKGIFTAAHLASGEDRRAGKGFDKFTSIFRNHINFSGTSFHMQNVFNIIISSLIY